MATRVLALRGKQNKIRRFIVLAILVTMVNDFVACQWTAKNTLGDDSVFVARAVFGITRPFFRAPISIAFA